MKRIIASIALAAALGSAPAFAQGSSIGTGSAGAAPAATAAIPPASGAAGDRTGSITGTGQTKPPGTAVGEGLGTRPDLDQRSRQLDRQIQTGICKGC